jgi:hypothetical protein
MVGGNPQASLAQRTGVALADALRQALQRPAQRTADTRIRRLTDLLIDGLEDEQLPVSLDRSRLRTPDSAAALAINTFLPWQQARRQLPLAGYTGFDAMQFEVRCPTGLRGTPPHLDLLALREDAAVAVTVRCTEYLGRRKSVVAPSYDPLLDRTPGLDRWRGQLERLRAHAEEFRFLDVGALVKYALALGRTFPDRPTVLLYLYWEPLDAEGFDEFHRHRAELDEVAEDTRGGRITFMAQSFAELWQDWAEREQPAWLGQHVLRLRSRYNVSLGTTPVKGRA